MSDLLERFKPYLCFDSRELSFPAGVEDDLGKTEVVYGREVAEGDALWCQYWLWFLRDWSPVPWRRGHSGDWEMIQVELAGEGPIRAAYAQHKGCEVKLWEEAERIGDRPCVYVGLGRHASLFHVTRSWFGDRCDGNGYKVDPTLVVMPETGWPLKPGRWGTDEHSPTSPGHHLQWRKPATWAAK